MSASTWMVANPASGRGRGARVLPAALRAFGDLLDGRVLRTEARGEEGALVRRAIDGGCDTLVVLGGDGTWSNAAHALVETGARCRLVPVAAGTGNDFAKTLGLPAADPFAMARLAREGGSREIDVGTIEGRAFVNSVGFGFDVAALEVAARTPWLGGSALYVYAALNLLFRYPGVDASVIEPALAGTDDPSAMRRLLGLVVANGARFGGTFIIAPQARQDDGLLDVIAIRDAGAIRRVGLLGAVARGAHTRGHVEVVTAASERVLLRFPAPPLYQADGELHRAANAEVELGCRRRALRVVSRASAPPPA